jgi:hypothetical protein
MIIYFYVWAWKKKKDVGSRWWIRRDSTRRFGVITCFFTNETCHSSWYETLRKSFLVLPFSSVNSICLTPFFFVVSLSIETPRFFYFNCASRQGDVDTIHTQDSHFLWHSGEIKFRRVSDWTTTKSGENRRKIAHWHCAVSGMMNLQSFFFFLLQLRWKRVCPPPSLIISFIPFPFGRYVLCLYAHIY